MKPAQPSIAFLVTEDWYFCSHRLPVARAARDAGFRVLVATRVTAHGEQIRNEGFELHPLPWARRGDGVIGGLRGLLAIVRFYRKARPDLVHHVALKPIIFGAVACRLSGVRHQVNLITGLGSAFASRSVKASLIRPVILTALRLLLRGRGNQVVLQNRADIDELAARGVIDPKEAVLIRSSGVDLNRFQVRPEPAGPVVVAMVSRMLRSKGVEVAVEAMRLLRSRGVTAELRLIGPRDPYNPDSATEDDLRNYAKEPLVSWLGLIADVPGVWANAHIALLPSLYREGVPKSLLEAASCGRPIVASDIPGCDEIVEHGTNGFLVPKGDSIAVADALQRLIEDRDLRLRMGSAGRRIAEEQFAEELVVSETLAVYRRLAGEKWPS